MSSVFSKRRALVTGASGGFGEQFAYQLAAMGANLILVARSTAKLEQVKTEILKRYEVEVHVLTCDLSIEQERVSLHKTVTEELKLEVDILVNNAGLGLRKPFVKLGWEGSKTLIDLNISSVTHMTHLFLPAMIERKFGFIEFVSSVAGIQPTPNYQVYGATKAFVRHFSYALAYELKGTGVTVSVVCPPHSETGFQAVANQPKDMFFHISHVSADNVVKESLSALANHKQKVIPGFLNKILFCLLGMLPEGLAVIATGMGNKYEEKEE